ncbi:hypothetical protein HWI79_1246 [Cryptosporidium felis]|nr:hypothetical protein HWI79_1246 [Cryptosporidium felis]
MKDLISNIKRALKMFYSSFRNFVVPYGSFGDSLEGQKAENFAFLVKLLVWIPLYIICGLLFFIFAQTGWFASMLASTGIQPYFEAPSISICPLTVVQGGFGKQIEEDLSEEFLYLNDTKFYLVLRSQGIVGYKKAPIRKCGSNCLCFETSNGEFSSMDGKRIEKHPIENSFVMKTSRSKELTFGFQELNLSGRLDVDYLELWMFHKDSDPKNRIVKVGLYGNNTPLVNKDFPKYATWHMIRLGDVTLFLLRLIRIRLEEFSPSQMLDLFLFFLPSRLKKHDASYYMYNIHSGHFKNPSLSNINIAQAVNRIKVFTGGDFEFTDTDSLTVLHLEASSKFVKEVYKIGQSMSIAALIGCLVILIVLVNNVGVFNLCFKRRSVTKTASGKETKPKLCVSGPVKALSCYILSENHRDSPEESLLICSDDSRN